MGNYNGNKDIQLRFDDTVNSSKDYMNVLSEKMNESFADDLIFGKSKIKVDNNIVLAFSMASYTHIFQQGYFTPAGYNIEFKAFRNIWWAYKEDTVNCSWVITDSPFMDSNNLSYYNASCYRIDQAIDDFVKKLNEYKN